MYNEARLDKLATLRSFMSVSKHLVGADARKNGGGVGFHGGSREKGMKVTDKPECNILEHLNSVYDSLAESHKNLLALFGEALEDDEAGGKSSGAVPEIRHLISRMDDLAARIATQVRRVGIQLG